MKLKLKQQMSIGCQSRDSINRGEINGKAPSSEKISLLLNKPLIVFFELYFIKSSESGLRGSKSGLRIVRAQGALISRRLILSLVE